MNLLDLLYPRQCPVCRKIVRTNEKAEKLNDGFPHGIGMEKLICHECYKQVPFVKAPVCFKCGKRIADSEKEYCTDCINNAKSFEQGIALLDYSKEISRHMIWGLKYQNKREYADFLALEMSRRFYGTLSGWSCEVLVPVPMYPSKKRKRGYNQAEVLAQRMSKILDIPVDNQALLRIQKTAPLKELSSQERMKNLKGAFAAGKRAEQYKRILLVDDIYTTGSTMQACTQALKKAGVEKVYAVSCCIGRGE